MDLAGPLAVAGAFAIFVHVAEQSIKQIPVSRPMPGWVRGLAAGCTAVVAAGIVEGLGLATPWRYSLGFCLLGCGWLAIEYAWARRHRCTRQGAGTPSR